MTPAPQLRWRYDPGPDLATGYLTLTLAASDPHAPLEASLAATSDPGPLADLVGRWSAPAFLAELEGLSAQNLARSLAVASSDTAPTSLGPASDVPGPEGPHLTLLSRSGTALSWVAETQLSGVVRIIAPAGHPTSRVPPPPAGIEAVFQPIVHLNDGRVVGFEALARQAASSPLATASLPGLAPLMLSQALAALAAMADQPRARALWISVNLTTADLEDPARLSALLEALADAGPLTRQLRFELTEQAAMRDPDRTLAALRALRAAGAGVVLDDFGGGHSSFHWLIDTPAEGFKLDQTLVARLTSPRGEAVIRALVGLARQLGLSLTAEGVETPDQAHALLSAGVSYGQGFLFAPGLPLAEALGLLAQRSRTRPGS
jgi:EAL domain-containing protein (putative c-di-GMP-specific phosphodiesterase class I)